MMDFIYPFGATPLDPTAAEGLVPTHIVALAELNEWEQANILEAEMWLSKRRHHCKDILTLEFVQKLHQKMFNQTWQWAGMFRRTNTNIGIDWIMIREQLKKLMDDVQYQINQDVYGIDEIAARFHHRLVSIHPFPNGNGRHARLATDMLLLALGQPRFSWGQEQAHDLYQPTQVRKNYIAALQAADRHDYQLLLAFVRA